MNKSVRLVGAIGALAFLIVLGVIGYFSWINIAFVDTLNARVEGSIVPVVAPGAGRIVDLNVEVGDSVTRNEEIGSLETFSAPGRTSGNGLLIPLRVPDNGVIVEKAARKGDLLSPGQTVVRLVDPQQLWIAANVHESRVPQVRIGQSVRVRLRTRAIRRTFWGKVEQIGRATNAALASSGRASDTSVPRASEVAVKISIDPEGYLIYPGVRAEVRITLDPRSW